MNPSYEAYRLLGRSGLRVSPLCLGTMTFGTATGWGSDKEMARRMFNEYVESGGNFVDTADGYQRGMSEQWVGEFIKETNSRDRIVLATKFTFNAEEGNPNAGGNGRKNIYRALEGSLKRLQTEYIDLYWMHVWDKLTPVEEVVSALTDIVREGKVRYIGFSNVPAWYASRAQTMAEYRGYERICALQLEYSLVSRNLEHEHTPMALELGMGICPWSPLASGFLTGKYKRNGEDFVGEGRMQKTRGAGNPVMGKYACERNWKILDVLLDVAKAVDRPPAEVALNWAAMQPAVVSTIIGARTAEQLTSNLKSLEFELPQDLCNRLDEASRPVPNELEGFFSPLIQQMIHGGVPVKR